jgi:hypothetical protein
MLSAPSKTTAAWGLSEAGQGKGWGMLRWVGRLRSETCGRTVQAVCLAGCKRTGCNVPPFATAIAGPCAFRDFAGGLLLDLQKEANEAGGKFAGQGGCGAVVEVMRHGINSSILLMGCPSVILVRISLR